MIIIYGTRDTVTLEHRPVGTTVPLGGIAVALVDGNGLKLLVDASEIDLPNLRAVAEELNVTLPEELRAPAPEPINFLKPGEQEGTSSDAPPAAPTFESLKASWGKTLNATAQVIRHEFSTTTAAVKEKADSSEGPMSTAWLKSSSHKAVIKGLGLIQRNLLSMQARIAEEGLSNRLESLSPEDRASFYALYLQELESLNGTKNGERLESWHKVVRRLVR